MTPHLESRGTVSRAHFFAQEALKTHALPSRPAKGGRPVGSFAGGNRGGGGRVVPLTCWPSTADRGILRGFCIACVLRAGRKAARPGSVSLGCASRPRNRAGSVLPPAGGD